LFVEEGIRFNLPI
jgi:hypothetical protein